MLYQAYKKKVVKKQPSNLHCIKEVIRFHAHWNQSNPLSEMINYHHHCIITSRQSKTSNKKQVCSPKTWAKGQVKEPANPLVLTASLYNKIKPNNLPKTTNQSTSTWATRQDY